jgi:hypothetical protein
MKQPGKPIFQFGSVIFMLLLGIIACGLPTEIPPTPTLNLPITFTIQAAIQQTATVVALTPTALPTSTATVAPPPAATIPCDAAEITGESEPRERAILKFGAKTNKIWRLKNIGACAWTTRYILSSKGGSLPSSDNLIFLSNAVAPGEVIEVSVPITAPNTYGFYQEGWVLLNANGQSVNVQNTSDSTLWIKIIASDASYDLVNSACDANWLNSNARKMNCPGQTSDQAFIIPLPFNAPNSVYAEDGRNYAFGLLMWPGAQNDGFISGIYPPQTIHTNDHFYALVGCLYKDGGSRCNIRFQVSVKSTIPGEPDKILTERSEIAEGSLNQLSADLSPFVGQNIQLILTVITNGPADYNQAIWVAPRIAPYSQP